MKISELMTETGVAFGTSGARGLADSITDLVGYSYTRAFLQHLSGRGEGKKELAIAGDLRPSTGRIMRAAARGARDAGYKVLNCGRIPSPAVALFGMRRALPTVMVTGSHIPADRNGIKYTTPAGEITKSDEQGIREQAVEPPPGLFTAEGAFAGPDEHKDQVTIEAARLYLRRYLDAFPEGLLKGRRIGVYEHSAVGRDLLVEIYAGLGAEVIRLGRSDAFIPVDTEAIRPEDAALAAQWAPEFRCDAIVSTDGDSDRPLLADESGVWLRGDILGILTAQFLEADAVVTPVSGNSALERSQIFPAIYRTRIGSPFVIAGMEQAARDGRQRVVGYEANGGFLQYSPVPLARGVLAPLPTRDPVIAHLAVLSLAIARRAPVSALRASLPARYTASDRLKEFPTEKSARIVQRLSAAAALQDYAELEQQFGALCGQVAGTDALDGLRVSFRNGEIIHLRPSGNAPEFRCYTEADSERRAEEILGAALAAMAGWRGA